MTRAPRPGPPPMTMRCAARWPGPGTARRWTRPRRRRCCIPAVQHLAGLLDYASRTRDAGLAAAGRPGVITYSRKVFIPLTRLCRDRCALLHVRHRARAGGQPLPVAGRGAGDRRGRCGAGLQGGAVHPGRPARGPVAPGPGMAGRARLRRHAVLRPGDGDQGAGGDRAAAAPEPGRAELAGLPAAQAGRAVHGDDAGDHRRPGCSPSAAARISAARTRTRRSGCGYSRTPGAARCRSPPAS